MTYNKYLLKNIRKKYYFLEKQNDKYKYDIL